MTSRVLLGIADEKLATDVRALVVEGIDLDVVGVATTGPEVMSACEQRDVDVVLLHEGLGPLPLLHLARDLGTRFPTIGVVLLVADPSPEILRGALQSGARGVASLPLSVDALEADLTAAAAWSASMRNRLAGERRDAERGVSAARMVVVAGAKGGVGTTTIALNLAMEAVADGAQASSVCLVDFDLQGGDVVNFLDLQHRRSVIDLLEVAEDLSSRHLEEALYPHPTGLHLLLAPEEGEQAEDVSGAHARQILGAIRGRFDVVIVDVGTVVTEGGAVATELADAVLLVTTPDVPAMRSANRLLQLWERLDIRKDGVEILVNRASKMSDVQPDLVERVVAAPRVPIAVPADYKGLQPAVNSGSPSRAADGTVRGAVRQVGTHVGLWPERAAKSARGGRLRRGEKGQGAVELLGVAPFVLLIVALAFQLGVVGLSFVFAGHAASEGARQLAVGASVGEAQTHAADRIPDRWSDTLQLADGGGGGTGQRSVTAEIRIPMLIPGINPDVRLRSSSGYVLESEVRGETP
jgi:pilus assembly protein CpaE